MASEISYTLLLAILLLLMHSINGDVNTPHVCKDDGKCFTVIVGQQYLSWEKAEEYCENNLPSGRLASVHNAFDNSLIASWLPFLATNPWIGAFRIGSLPFTWTDGTDFNTQYTNWSPGQPSERCAQVCSSTTNAGNTCQQGKWTTADCSSQAQFICEYGTWNETTTTPPPVPSCPDQWSFFPATQACYRAFYSPVQWFDAEETCMNNNGHLTSIHSDAENNFVWDLVSQYIKEGKWSRNQIFIGLIDIKHDRHFIWSDGSAVNYSNWAARQPDNSNGDEYCGELLIDSDQPSSRHWNDVGCELSNRAFVCKRAPNWSG